jgi:predicted RNA binding protein YcfA (HicA-like mRNA interferase family)
MSLSKYDEDSGKSLVTIIPNTSDDLPPGTLMDILGMKQTRIRKIGLLRLLGKDV